MNYFADPMFVTILKKIYSIIFIHVFTANSNDSNLNEAYLSDLHYKEINIFDKVIDIKQELVNIFPFINSIEDLCIECSKISLNDIDNLNLGECKNVKSFRLKYCSIRLVPEYIKSFKNINHLNFLSNTLSSACFDLISKLTTLKSLDLRYNSIKEITPSILKLVNLEELSLDRNFVTYIPDFLFNLKLKKLSLKNLMIHHPKKGCILKIINDCLKIKTLENFMIDLNNLSGFEFDKKEYCLKRLSLAYCKLSSLSDSILTLKKLEYLNLEGNKFTIVPEILVQLENLRELNLKRNPIISYENIIFHSLATLHIQCNQNTKGKCSIKNNFPSPLKDLFIYMNSNYHNKVNLGMSTMKNLKTLSIHESYKIKIPKNIYILKDLESLSLDGKLNKNIIYSISLLENLKSLTFSFKGYKTIRFIEVLFPVLANVKKLESLTLTEYDNNTQIDDKLCGIKTLRKLCLNGFYIENIAYFDRLKNLKSIHFNYTEFNESKTRICLFLRLNKVKFTYEDCKFDCNHVIRRRKVNFF